MTVGLSFKFASASIGIEKVANMAQASGFFIMVTFIYDIL
ncbi:hypothetical protein E9M_00741 [Moraxella catarrhalis 46P47B1]|nr:hypothetical protein E9M_00741 [Moraxella catarrhalis 46P47B1]EGE17894.1 hypothetical protein E9Q_05329 [Moraxella catarrhalis BC1]EGE18646.1 hypothetical protein E9S_07420 [Moraxella catarrhalis BC7]EGE18770.1 hypothetical protein E9U_08033 [Moraxella catarrhalis BC8]EGE22558.1 hypothetical protein E9W_09042 [Moraxella catarrhalis CO72]EGE25528.1 hypothetical protein EA1_06328 [Moraxella catarrhalis O35E]